MRDWNGEFAELVGEQRLAEVRPPRERSAEEIAERQHREAELRRRLAEAAVAEQRHERERRRRQSRRRLKTPLIVGLVIAAIAGATWWDGRGDDTSSSVEVAGTSQVPAPSWPVDPRGWVTGEVVQLPPEMARGLQRPDTWPTKPVPRNDRPNPPDPPPGEGGYTFVNTQPDRPDVPITYDPCVPIHYVIRTLPGTERFVPLIHEAIAGVSAATGLRFIDDGPVDEAPVDERPLVQPDRYGDRWAPVLIAFSNETETPMLAGDVVGTGGSASVGWNDTPAIYVTGTVTLDSPDLLDAARTDNASTLIRSVALHELAHLVGIGHVDDPTSLMFERAGDVVDFSDADRRGLARVGDGPCVPEI